VKDAVAKFIATGAWSGYFPLVPGSIGTLPAWGLAYFWLGHSQLALGVALAITMAAGVWAAGYCERFWGHDPRKIVIDEWAGMFISVLFVPLSITNYLIALVGFRVFDVIKLWPARRLENLPGGWGVMMDDVAAGIQTNIVVQIILLLVNWR